MLKEVVLKKSGSLILPVKDVHGTVAPPYVAGESANTMILSHKFKFIFFCNGKTGTTSIERALKKFDESCDMNKGCEGLWVNKHIPPAVLKSFLPSEVWNSYFKFVFVRHPLDWFVSQYRHNFRTPRFPSKLMLRLPTQAFNLIWRYKTAKKLALKQVFTTKNVDFLYRYLRPYRGLPYSPSLMQSSYVYDADGNILVDFIGRFENLSHDVKKVKTKIGIDFELLKLNKTVHQPYQHCFTVEAAERVKVLWDIDFRNFGYQMDLVEPRVTGDA